MAERGKPLAFSHRANIQTMVHAQRMPIKLVARALDMSRNTVRKYARKPGK